MAFLSKVLQIKSAFSRRALSSDLISVDKLHLRRNPVPSSSSSLRCFIGILLDTNSSIRHLSSDLQAKLSELAAFTAQNASRSFVQARSITWEKLFVDSRSRKAMKNARRFDVKDFFSISALQISAKTATSNDVADSSAAYSS